MPIAEVTGIASTIPNLWKELSNIGREWISRNDFLHAIDFETRLNMDLIAAFKLGGLAGKTTAASPAFRAKLDPQFVNLLSTGRAAGAGRKCL